MKLSLAAEFELLHKGKKLSFNITQRIYCMKFMVLLIKEVILF
jgi:hypothetical protein